MRTGQLTFTRFIAAISIVIFHYGQDISPFNNIHVKFLFEQANIGVSYFFILSGFVMIIAYSKKTRIDSAGFLKNRFARIYPVYLLAFFLVLVLSVLAKNINAKDIWLNLFMIQAWFPGEALTFNYPGWSLSVEIFFYVVFPFLFNSIYKVTDYKNLTIPVTLVWIVSHIIFHVSSLSSFNKWFSLSNKDLLYFPLLHLNKFLIGNMAGFYFLDKAAKSRRNFDWQIIMIIFMIVLALKFRVGLIGNNGLLDILFVPLILLISLNKGKLTAIFERKAFVFLGEISFGVYILQYPVWGWINEHRLEKYFNIDKVDTSSVAFFIRLFSLISLASLSYLFFETPVREKIKSFHLTLAWQK